MRRWIILDRDGTLNVDTGYLHEPEKAMLESGAAEGLKKLGAAGFNFVVVSNQSGIGRGYFTQREVDATNMKIAEMLMEYGIKIEGWYCCPHSPADGCICRKPNTALVLQAEKELGFTAEEINCVIGDKKADVQLGENLGVAAVLVATGEGQRQYEAGTRGTYFAKDLNEAADWILEVTK